MTRLKLIKKITSEWFDSHKFVNEVYWGDFIRWYADKQLKHSSVIITPIRVTEVTRSKRAIQLQITYADRVYSDFRNLDEVHSDADRTLADFVLSASNDKDLRKYLTGLTSGSIEYFTNRTGDLVAGATMSVSLNVFSDANSCEIPVEFDPTPPPFECADANYIVEYDNGTLIESGTIPSGGSVTVEVPNPITCQDANYTLTDSLGNVLDSGTILSGGSVTIAAPDATFTISDSQGNLIESGSIPSGGNEDVTLPEIWWERPAGWLPMPTITAADNKFAGLYAVWEEDVDNNTITIDVGAGLTIDYGDGTVITSIGGVNTHNYDYATISSAVLVSSDGRNYKMVIVEVDLTGVITMSLNQGITGRPIRPTGWLDILASGSNLQEIRISGNFATLIGFAKYLERLRVLNMSATAALASRAFENLSSIRVVDYPLLTNGTGFNSTFGGSSDIRDSNGNPLNITGASGTDFRSFAVRSGLIKIGNIDYPTATTSFLAGAFQDSQIQEIGNINFPAMTILASFLRFTPIKTLGIITVTTALTNINRFAIGCRNIREIVFAGDMSGVNDTTLSFRDTNSLTRLILPNITRGFDIKDSRVSGTNLQDLFTSLGTANGAQTITLPSFTSGESTIIATGKGYTIAYA